VALAHQPPRLHDVQAAATRHGAVAITDEWVTESGKKLTDVSTHRRSHAQCPVISQLITMYMAASVIASHIGDQIIRTVAAAKTKPALAAGCSASGLSLTRNATISSPGARRGSGEYGDEPRDAVLRRRPAIVPGHRHSSARGARTAAAMLRERLAGRSCAVPGSWP
jgi:hypothetical protein